MNRLSGLGACGQSIWFDYISRKLISSGELNKLVQENYITGVTSNPSIFAQALKIGADYDDFLQKLSKNNKSNIEKIYERLAVKDIQEAADILRPIYDETKYHDGFVSLEISPHLAHNFEKSVQEAQNLWHQVDRPNLMIKIPGTDTGMKITSYLISQGININITLLFDTNNYKKAAMAYLDGLKKRVDQGLPLESVSSVASFFISRIDSKIDKLLENLISQESGEQKINNIKVLLGKIAIANAQVAYSLYEEIYSSAEAQALIRKGAYPQRLLWASTSTKNPNYSDILYVEKLIGKNTINTLPPKTLEEFKNHGEATPTIKKDCAHAPKILDRLELLGVNLSQVCAELLDEGIKLFQQSHEEVLQIIKKKI